MRYLKLYEESIKKNDLVILLRCSDYALKQGYSLNKVYTVGKIDLQSSNPYFLLLNDWAGLWFDTVNIRKATKDEIYLDKIGANQYNL